MVLKSKQPTGENQDNLGTVVEPPKGRIFRVEPQEKGFQLQYPVHPQAQTSNCSDSDKNHEWVPNPKGAIAKGRYRNSHHL